MQRRKVTLKLDPNAAQSARLEAWTRLHCELDNAALEERIDAWHKARKTAASDCRALTRDLQLRVGARNRRPPAVSSHTRRRRVSIITTLSHALDG